MIELIFSIIWALLLVIGFFVDDPRWLKLILCAVAILMEIQILFVYDMVAK
jgi:hypothetical protein